MIPPDARQAKPFYNNAWIYFLIGMLVIIAGFLPSFFLKLSTTDFWHHIHGMSATLWLSLLVIQPLLYKLGKMDVHRSLGKISYLVVPLLVIGGFKMIATMIQHRNEYPPLDAYRLGFLDTVSTIAFIYLFAMAIRHVRTTGLHARYMAATVILLEPPGLGRLLFRLFPGYVNNFVTDLHITFIVLEVVIILLLLDDRRRDGTFSKPYLTLLALFVFLHITMPFSATWQWWQHLSVLIFD
jgi:hypothetical protein